MKPTIRTTSAAIAAVVAGGISSVFLGAAPADAATPACGATGALISAGICEQTFTSGTSTFTPTAAMTKLEVLLVGAGGNGADQPVTSVGYAAAGGGGEVKVVDFSGTTSPMTVTVPTPGTPALVTDGITTATVGNGGDAFPGGAGPATGGASGNGNLGATSFAGSGTGGGGGAGGATTTANGGAGVMVSSLVTASSLFIADSTCYGGGGASGLAGSPAVQGIATCGGGGPSDATSTALTAALANSGGGGGGIDVTQPLALRQGADGIVVIRWNAATVTLTFDANGHGTAPATQSIVAGSTATKPADPTATGFQFDGWFTDPGLTTPADFSAPIVAPTTFFAKWTPVLAPTGVEVSPAVVPLSAGALIIGAGLLVLSVRRRRAD
jgi:uncharacterized repeat protein (TIGR02543 family)